MTTSAEPTLDEVYQALAGCWCETAPDQSNRYWVPKSTWQENLATPHGPQWHCRGCHKDLTDTRITGHVDSCAWSRRD